MYPRFLVFAQFTLSAAIVLLGFAGLWQRMPWVFSGVVLGGLMEVHAIRVMGLTKLRVHPAPGASTTLCDRGIYHWIRHPMYSGLLLATGCLAIGVNPPWLGALLWIALLIDLDLKARLEERLLCQKLPGYPEYMQRTRRLIPGLY